MFLFFFYYCLSSFHFLILVSSVCSSSVFLFFIVVLLFTESSIPVRVLRIIPVPGITGLYKLYWSSRRKKKEKEIIL